MFGVGCGAKLGICYLTSIHKFSHTLAGELVLVCDVIVGGGLSYLS